MGFSLSEGTALLCLPGVPTQPEIDRLLSVYETWVQVDVATPEAVS